MGQRTSIEVVVVLRIRLNLVVVRRISLKVAMVWRISPVRRGSFEEAVVRQIGGWRLKWFWFGEGCCQS